MPYFNLLGLNVILNYHECRDDLFKIISETLIPAPAPSFEDASEQQQDDLSKSDLHTSNTNLPKKRSSIRPKIPTRFRRKSKTKRAAIKKPPRPPLTKECHLTNVLRSAVRCLNEFHEARETFTGIVARDEQLAHGVRKTTQSEENKQLAHVALNITNLCREAFIPAHRLNQTAIALYCAEDFLRYPSDIRAFNLQTNKTRIKLPEMAFNNATVMKLRQVVDLAADIYNKFNAKGKMAETLREVLFNILRGCQDFYAATLGCQEIFKVLLYVGPKEKAHLQQFFLGLSAMDRSDLLEAIQELRRVLDEIVIFLEKLSWGSFVVYRLSGGDAGDENSATVIKPPLSAPAYQDYPLIKSKEKKVKVAASRESKLTAALSDDMSKLQVETEDRGVTPKVGMKKSKFSKRKNMKATVDEKMAAVGDANHEKASKAGSKTNTSFQAT